MVVYLDHYGNPDNNFTQNSIYIKRGDCLWQVFDNPNGSGIGIRQVEPFGHGMTVIPRVSNEIIVA